MSRYCDCSSAGVRYSLRGTRELQSCYQLRVWSRGDIGTAEMDWRGDPKRASAEGIPGLAVEILVGIALRTQRCIECVVEVRGWTSITWSLDTLIPGMI